MKIQILAGGLANQIQNYAFVRFAQRYRPSDRWFFDDSSYFIPETCVHNGYELEKLFGVKLPMLSSFFPKSTWKEILKKIRSGLSMPEVLLNMGIPITMFRGKRGIAVPSFSGNIVEPEGDHIGFNTKYLELPYENIYYAVLWVKKNWFMAYADENRKELQFPELQKKSNLEYCKHIKSCYAVGIHVRRRDFLTLHWDASPGKYKVACQNVLNTSPKAHFFIFSDDLDWCYKNRRECGFDLAPRTIYVEGNKGPDNYIDMQLLSMCIGMIRNGRSTFSQVAGWMNPHLQFDIKIEPEQKLPYANKEK